MSVLDWEDWLSIYVNLEAVGLGSQLYPPDHLDFMNCTRIVLTSLLRTQYANLYRIRIRTHGGI